MAFDHAIAKLETRGDIALLTIDSPPVNAIGHAIRLALLDAVAEVEKDAGVKALVVTCAGKTFFAGADIAELAKGPAEPLLPTVINTLEDCSKPVIAAVHGTALGGGAEIALGCHYRVAVPSAQFGMPEVDLGFLPGAGGTQRLPRLVGVAKALETVALAKRLKAGEPGLVDKLADGDLVEAALAFAETVKDKPVVRTRDRAVPAYDEAVIDDFAKANAKKFKHLEAPKAIIDLIRATMKLDFATGIAMERKASLELRAGFQSRALRHAFFAERQAGKLPKDVAALARKDIATVGVIGSGTMGVGISLAFLGGGYKVRILDRQADALDRGIKRIRDTIAKNVASGRTPAAKAEAQNAALTQTMDFADLADCDIVVEAAFETMAVKQDVFAELDKVCKADAILASNTSYLDIDQIAAATTRPQQVVGMHFFSPANIMKLLEVVRAEKTAPDVLLAAVEVGRKLGKIPVVVGVCNGFVGNRILRAQRNDLEALLVEGASPAEVDAAWSGFGFPMGPFAMLDLAGLDISWRARKALGQTAEIADHLCEQGRFGQKTGRGFYRYEPGERKPLADSEVEDLAKAIAAREGITRRSIPAAEIVERLLYPMINEGARILEEGIAQRPGDIDVIWIFGYGFPAWRGGPMHAAGSIGLAKIRDGLQARFEQSGRAEFKPAALLERLAAEGGSFAG